MFEGISDNVVLDMQRAAPHAAPTRVAMWTVIINPLTKVALTLTPVAMALEVGRGRCAWCLEGKQALKRTEAVHTSHTGAQ